MKFPEFIQKLSSVIRAGENTANFTKAILEEIVIESGIEILKEYSSSSFKAFYNGNTTIRKLALKINRYVDPMLFSEFLKNYEDANIEAICDAFRDSIPEITPHNAHDLLADLFAKIIIEAAGTNKKSTHMGAKSKQVKENTPLDAKEKISIRIPKNLKDELLKIKSEPNPEPIYIPNTSVIEKAIIEATKISANNQQGVFDTYLRKAKDYYSQKKTLLYAEKPRPFYDIYVCNDVCYHTPRTKDSTELKSGKPFSEATISQLESESQYIIIEGTGGIGKSMFLTHLFLSSVSSISENTYDKYPVLIPLKDYKSSLTTMSEFIFSAITTFDSNINQDIIIELLKNKKIVLLLDGLDEISSAVRSAFDNCLESFIKSFPGNTIVMTSRPVNSFVSYTKFTLFDLKPLTKEQSLKLIDKLDFWDTEAKRNFRIALDAALYYSHTQFASNPLLLTIMLMTYSTFGEIPEKMHVFYAKAYETMARLHDSTKGSFVRPLHTNLTPENFKRFFSEFCARTYEAEVLEFTELSFSDYMKKVITKASHDSDITPRDFLLDLTDNLCIMYREGDKYFFIHRSFQEYFAALYFSSMFDKKLIEVGKFFESSQKRFYTDKTFGMLYDMIPKKVEHFIFLPFLQKQINRWKNKNPNKMYWNFIVDQYPVIFYEKGDTGCDSINAPKSFLLQFITYTKNLDHTIGMNCLKWPKEISDMRKQTWVVAHSFFTNIEAYKLYPDPRYIPKSALGYQIIYAKDELPVKYTHYFGNPDVVGYTIEIDTDEICKYPQENLSLWEFINNVKFPLRKEFKNIIKYFEELKSAVSKEQKSNSLFDD